ncbi:HD-GYP domain-containing protein [Paenibacillus qinlingensis]|uniref:HD-GYP domain-containing protein (C-di-GMP phosphodiesterase class II) n=1 Tax=Paenibacillus qinlingensis TaxID=1837343 RepID=A0ABU1NRA7_9BACL|nr:HD-GYP domain-containing protein [Paenibacillus qinlingensis]MDR6549989.1 HD-GYP domain-containing protein (c-di-GMP phosphodiesterase class II) [Paenibacillus qinlingensis]
MIIVPTTQCQPGMRIGKAILSEQGRVMIGYGVELTQFMIRKLVLMGLDFLYIEDRETDDITIEESIHEETRALLRIVLSKIFSKFSATSSLHGSSNTAEISTLLFEGITRVIEDMRKGRHNLVSLTTLNMVPATTLEQHFCQNAIHVCVYATKLGMLHGYSQKELTELGLGALLHDVGNIQLPAKLLLSRTKLTASEFVEIQKHTELGFHMLKEDMGIPLLTAICALQHHERINGSGYPHNLQGTQIHEYARWIGMLDSYDAMTHPRAYRNSIAPHYALEILYANAGTLFDIKKVTEFRNKVAIFPVGQGVKLSTGELGVVCRHNTHIPSRPVVRVLTNERGEKIKSPFEIDLSSSLHVMIDLI